MVSHSITRRSNDLPASINSTKVKQTSLKLSSKLERAQVKHSFNLSVQR